MTLLLNSTIDTTTPPEKTPMDQAQISEGNAPAELDTLLPEDCILTPDSSEETTTYPLKVEQSLNHVTLIPNERVDLAQSSIYLNSVPIENLSFDLAQDGTNVLSWELKDAMGTILDSSEMTLMADLNAPNISALDYQDVIYLFDSLTMPINIEDDNLDQVQIWIDGVLQEDSTQVRLERNNKKLKVIAIDRFGNSNERIWSIQALPLLQSDFVLDQTNELSTSLLEVFLEENYEDCLLKLSCQGQETVLPFESASLQTELEKGALYTVSIIHPAAGTIASFTVIYTGAESDTVQDSTPEKPEPSTPAVEEIQTPQKPAQVVRPAVQPEAIIETTVSTPVQTQIKKPDALLSLYANSSLVSQDNPLYFNNTPAVDVKVENGRLLEVVYVNEQKQEFTSLKKALEASPESGIEVIASAVNEDGKTSSATWNLIPKPKAVTAGIESGKEAGTVRFELDENGKMLSTIEKTESRTAWLALGNKEITDQSVAKGETVRLYLQNADDIVAIKVNGKELSNPSIQMDELGQSYVELKSSSDLNVQVRSQKDGIWSACLKTKAGQRNWMPAGLAAAAGLFTAGLFGLRRKKRV